MTRDLPDLAIWFFVPLILFSIVKTKLSWYLIPLNIPLEICSALCLARILQGPKKEWFTRLAASVVAVAILIPGVAQVWREIAPPSEDPLQEFLSEQRTTLSKTYGETAYLAVPASEMPYQGLQKYVLLGELYYDWNCKTNGVDVFLDDPAAQVLLLFQRQYQEYESALSACTTVAQNEYFRIVRK